MKDMFPSTIKIVCPSKGRCDNVRTLKLIPDLTLIVPEREAEDYRANYPDTEVIGTPDTVRGIVATRQWILDNYDDVFMIDDDIKCVQRNFAFGDQELNTRDVAKIHDIIESTTNMARDIGAKVFSFSKIRHPMEYHGFEPISHTGYMNASFCGFLKGHGLRYDLSMIEGEDHYISCINAVKNRYCLIDNRYSFISDGNFTAIGGCNGYRTNKSMEDTTLYLRKLFGDAIQLKQPTKSKAKVNKFERSLHFPY